MLLEGADGDVEAAVGAHRALGDGVLVGVRQREEDAVGLDVGELEAGDPLHGRQRVVAGAQQRFAQRAQL
ncbi:MAG: hypothetical protein R6T98_10675, partial [Desulfatiglandales bacterium]